MSSKHLDALEQLFDSVEEELGACAGPKTSEALGTAKRLINEDREKKKRKKP
jgi:hypothetical protein